MKIIVFGAFKYHNPNLIVDTYVMTRGGLKRISHQIKPYISKYIDPGYLFNINKGYYIFYFYLR